MMPRTRRAIFGSCAGAVSGAASNSRRSSSVIRVCAANAAVTSFQRRSRNAASASRQERSSAMSVRTTTARGDSAAAGGSADEGIELAVSRALRAVLLDRLDPRLAHPADVRKQITDLLRVALHVRRDELVVPELVDAEQVRRDVAVEIQPQRAHQQRARALRAPQEVVTALDVAGTRLHHLDRLPREEQQRVVRLDDELFGARRVDRGLE